MTAQLYFDVDLRSGNQAQGLLHWSDKKLSSRAVSGTTNNFLALPNGQYLVKKKGYLDKTDQAFCDAKGSCWFQYIEPQFATDRKNLGIHPDGKPPGTAGCIGLKCEDSQEWRKAFAALSEDQILEVRDQPALHPLSPFLALSPQAGHAIPWPADEEPQLNGFYGKHQLGATGMPTAQWEREHLTQLALPYPMRLSWNHGVQVKKLSCHLKVRDSLAEILAGILRHFGSYQEVVAARMDLLGGCYSYRRIAGSHRLSTHSWGAAIDLDPEANPMGKLWEPGVGMMPLEVVSLFESCGWRWGGRFQRADAMHFQATQ